MPDVPSTNSQLITQFPSNNNKLVTAQNVRNLVVSKVTTQPETDQDNVVKPTAPDVAPLVIQGAAEQTADLLPFKDADGNILSRVDADGNFVGDVTGNADTATTAVNLSGTIDHTQVNGFGTAALSDTTDFDASGAAETAEVNANGYTDEQFQVVNTALGVIGEDLDTKLTKGSNLSDLTNAGTARTNLGLGTAATQNTSAFDASGAASAAQAASLQKTSNLSDLSSVSTARTNLGLGSAALSATTDFDASGAAAAVLATSVQTADITIIRGNHVYAYYNAASNTDTARATAVRTAYAAASSGDQIFVSYGNFDFGATYLGFPAGVTITGAPNFGTKFSSTLSTAVDGGAHCCFDFGNNGTNVTNNIWFEARNTDGTYQLPVGFISTPGNATFNYCKVTGQSDGFYIEAGITSAFLYTNHCLVQTSFDCVAILGNTDHGYYYEDHGSTFQSLGPFSGLPKTTNNCINVPNGTVKMYGSKMTSGNTGVAGAQIVRGISNNSNSWAKTYLNECEFNTSNSGSHAGIGNPTDIVGAAGEVHLTGRCSGSGTNGTPTYSGNVYFDGSVKPMSYSLGGVQLQNPVFKTINISNLASGTTTLWTPPAVDTARKLAVISYNFFNLASQTSGTVNAYLAVTNVTSTGPIMPSVAVTQGNQFNGACGCVCSSATTLKIVTDAAGLNGTVTAVEFDSLTPLSTVFTRIGLTANTWSSVYTAANTAGVSGTVILDREFRYGTSGGNVYGFNSAATTKNLKVAILPSGGTISDAYSLTPTTAFVQNVYNSLPITGTMQTGDKLYFQSDSTTTTFLFMTNIAER